MPVSKEHPVYKYDDEFDVMHVHYADRWLSSVEEEHPYILVHYDDRTNECTGFTIMDYTKHKHELKKFYPNDFAELPDEIGRAHV